MPQKSLSLSRRAFIGDAVLASVGTLAVAKSLRAQSGEASSQKEKELTSVWPELPERVLIEEVDGSFTGATKAGSAFSTTTVKVTIEQGRVRVSCPRGPLSRVVLRWQMHFPADTLFLGDHWERGYGDLQWRFLQPERIMPWYFAAHRAIHGTTFMLGVATQPAALCFWMIDGDGISLWLDFRNGGSASIPGDREIFAATLVSMQAEKTEGPMAALKRFCRALCPNPRLPAGPVVGNNNWYYAYGHDFDAHAMRRDATFLAELSEGHPDQAYCVIDAGWTPGSSCPGGPWTEGDPQRFPDMIGLARDMKKMKVRPGIWVRPTALTKVDNPHRLRAGPVTGEEKPLDLTLPENRALIHDDVARIRSWGYELIKHDFSTYDLLGKWGFEMGAEITEAGWHFADQSLTNAEIILSHYKNLRAAAGDAVLIGCNSIGHLGAGLFEIQRTGDDTSGHVWERTRRMGVNTLAFRLPQHRSFFVSDADCVAFTEKTPWSLTTQYLELVSKSGTALFLSTDPRTITAEQKSVFRAAVQLALSAPADPFCEPIDWLETTSPNHWHLGQETKTYDWTESFGTLPYRI